MKSKNYVTRPVRSSDIAMLGFSQNKVKGFAGDSYQNARVLMIGAGGIGTLVGHGLVRKGIGRLTVCDDDDVEIQNLTRQLFHERDIGKNKALALARILSKQGFFSTQIKAFPCRFQEMLESGALENYESVICGVDNNPSRVAAAKWCREKGIPYITCGVSRDASFMYCAVQEKDQACFGCMLPAALDDGDYPCQLPGIIDTMMLVASFTIYALDTVLMGRHREWNLCSVSLDGSMPASQKIIAKKTDCPLCGHNKAN